MSLRVLRAWIWLALICSAIWALLWVKYRGSQIVRDLVAYGLLLGAVCVVSFYCAQTIYVRGRRGISVGESITLAQAKSPAWFYIGAAGVGLGFVLNGILLWSFVEDIDQFPQRLHAALRGPSEMQVWLVIALCAFAIGFLFTWFGAFQIRINSSGIEYWSLFGGYRFLSSGEIKRAQIRIGWDRNRPPLRLEILPVHGGRAKKPIIINLKVFRASDLNRVFDWLGPKLDGRDKFPIGRGA